jgi:ribosomal protein S26
MQTNILQFKRKIKNERGRLCYARYTNCEDQEVEKDFAISRSTWNEIVERGRTHQGF